MSELIFYTNPQSRGQIVRWMLEEVGAPYRVEALDYASSMKQEPYLSINPMGKVPAIVHDGKVVTECAAICAYLADAFPQAGLAPDPGDRADYYRWLFFAAGPIEAAFSNKAMGWEPDADRQRMFGYGNWDLAISTLERAVQGESHVAAGRFTAADVYVGSQLGFMMDFKMLEPRPAFSAYVEGLRQRPAFARAKQLDEQLAADMKAHGQTHPSEQQQQQHGQPA
jgi:glutathione S-transferase